MTPSLTLETFLASTLILSSGYIVNWFIQIIKRSRRRFVNNEVVNNTKDSMIIERIDGQIEENIRSFFQQKHPEYEIVFPVKDFQDPLISKVKSLMLDYPDFNAKLVTNKTLNGKSYCWLRYSN